MAESAGSLPVVVVSAANKEAAMAFINDLVGTEGEPAEQSSRVWSVSTKYYRARLRLVACGDGDTVPQNVEAHVIVLSDDESSSPSKLQARAQSVSVNEDGVLIVASPVQPPSLQAAALALHYELVPLTAPEDPEDPEDPEPWGMEAVRGSLHAHLWPNLERVTEALHNGSTLDDDASSEPSDLDPEEMLARCEEFADALAAVQGARETVEEEQWARGREQRLRRAEELLAVVTRAMR